MRRRRRPAVSSCPRHSSMSIRSRLEEFREARARSRGASSTPAPAVPLAHMRDDAPSGDYLIASEYLLADTRLRRRETVFHAYVSELGSRTIEVDFSLPAGGEGTNFCYVPVAFFPKSEVAPSLEVCDAGGRVLAIPTKRENMALTERAIEKLVEADALLLGNGAKSRELIREVISRDPFPARVSRILFQNREPSAAGLFQTLGLLEDHFLLWAPVQGPPRSQHHLSVCRSEPHGPLPIVERKRRPVTVPVQTAVGKVWVRAGLPVGRPTIDLTAVIARVLNRFALRPVEADVYEAEAARFASCHLRVHAPPGFLVRDIRVGVADGSPQDRIEELDADDPHAVVQGIDQDVGHVHLSKTDNPRRVYLNVALGLRGGNTTLWMLATVLTAALLWLVHHHPSYGPPRFENKQIVAGALLVGPAFASAWSLRAEAGELLRTSLAGARVLLLLSAALSVATALALAEILPFGLDRYDLISAYASMSYFVAFAMIAAWLLSSKPTWQIFRSRLHSQPRNLFAILLLGLIVALIGVHSGLPIRVAGVLLLCAGLSLITISANTVAEPLRGSRTFYRPVAGLGALPVAFAAGYFLGFYTNRFDIDVLRLICLLSAGALVLFAFGGFFFATGGDLEESSG
jgi:hypothetical protein